MVGVAVRISVCTREDRGTHNCRGETERHELLSPLSAGPNARIFFIMVGFEQNSA